MIVSNDMRTVLLEARRIFFEQRLRVRIDPHRPRRHLPRLGEDLRIFDGRAPRQRLAFAREALDNVRLRAMKPAIGAEPAVFDEMSRIDDERVAVPATD